MRYSRPNWYLRQPLSCAAQYLGRVPFTPAMPDGQNDHPRCVYAIDNAIGMLEDLSVRCLPDLGNDPTALRKSPERRDPIQELVEPGRARLWTICRDGVYGLTRSQFRER